MLKPFLSKWSQPWFSGKRFVPDPLGLGKRGIKIFPRLCIVMAGGVSSVRDSQPVCVNGQPGFSDLLQEALLPHAVLIESDVDHTREVRRHFYAGPRMNVCGRG
jgi:hypothetical protein